MTPSVRLTILYQAINDEKKTNKEEHARRRWRCDALEEGSLGPFEGLEAGTPANSWAAHTTILASLFLIALDRVLSRNLQPSHLLKKTDCLMRSC